MSRRRGGVRVGAGKSSGLGATRQGAAVVCGQGAGAIADGEGRGGAEQVELDTKMALADGWGGMRGSRFRFFSVEGGDANGE